jgi:hypothetical protein
VEKELSFSDKDKLELPGTYFHPPAQRVEIILKNDKLFLRRGSTDLPLRKIGTDRISAAAEGAARGQQYVIVRGKNGKSLYLHSGGRALKKTQNREH